MMVPDFLKFIEAMCEKSARLDKYAFIMKRFAVADVSSDEEFKRAFVSFYRVRCPQWWIDGYFVILQEMRSRKDVSIRVILERLCEMSGGRRIDLSFASKMLHTIQPDMPIWDSVVATNLDLAPIPASGSMPSRIEAAVERYSSLLERMDEMLRDDSVKAQVAMFDSTLPNYAWLSSVKKVDFMLWQSRAHSE